LLLFEAMLHLTGTYALEVSGSAASRRSVRVKQRKVRQARFLEARLAGCAPTLLLRANVGWA
jgi:hypothetical protein